MGQPVTVEVLLWVIGGFASVLGLFFAVNAKARAAMHKRINEFSLKVAEDYATNTALTAMERRLVEHLTRIEAKVDLRNGSERART